MSIGYYRLQSGVAFKKSDSSIVSDILALRGRVMSPLCEDTLSTGADVAGPQKRLANSGRRDAHVGLSLVNNGAPSSVTKTS
jgi:hypothetical protein